MTSPPSPALLSPAPPGPELLSPDLLSPDLLSTALLGTARRPLAGGGTPSRLLDLAAIRRARVTPVRPEVPATAERCPADGLPLGPAAAQDVLIAELAQPQPARIDALLEHWVAHRLGVDPYAWTALARLAVRSRRIHRPRLGAAIGVQGRWFLRQNPDWRRLAAESEGPTERGRQSNVAAVLERLALESASKPLRPGYVAEIALTVAPRSYPDLRAAVRVALDDNPRLRPAAAVVEETLWWRCQVERIFDPAWTVSRTIVPAASERSA